MSNVQLFISHCEKDGDLARDLTDWLQSGLGLEPQEVRCTSVSGLEAGASAHILRDDLESAEEVIGLITTDSLNSSWVQFEMGAAWLKGRLKPVRGPGIKPDDLRRPLSDLTTVGFCEREGMQRLLQQLANSLGKTVQSGSEETLEEISSAAEQALLRNLVDWFSLPPVLSAWRIDPQAHIQPFQQLCASLSLQEGPLRDCSTKEGVLNRDPESLPVWAKDLWAVSKYTVNYMLFRRVGFPDDFPDVPPHVLDRDVVSRLRKALSTSSNRKPQVRNAFKEAIEWISANPPYERRGHAGVSH